MVVLLLGLVKSFLPLLSQNVQLLVLHSVVLEKGLGLLAVPAEVRGVEEDSRRLSQVHFRRVGLYYKYFIRVDGLGRLGVHLVRGECEGRSILVGVLVVESERDCWGELEVRMSVRGDPYPEDIFVVPLVPVSVWVAVLFRALIFFNFPEIARILSVNMVV